MKSTLFTLIIVLFALVPAQSYAQISISFDALPYQNFSKPDVGLENAEVLSRTTNFSIGYPFMLNEGRTMLGVELSWATRQFEYSGFPAGGPGVDALHEGGLMLTLMHPINEKWSFLGIVAPALASDLHGDLTKEDFNFQVIAAGIRKVSPRFTYGIGAAYSTQFGEPIPLPVALIEWNNEKKLSWRTILPISSEFWYAHSNRVELGLILNVDGNDFQGDPGRYEVDDPQLRYSVTTFGPTARFALANNLFLQVDAGIVPYQRFEFFDGRDKQASFNIKESAFARISFSYGG